MDTGPLGAFKDFQLEDGIEILDRRKWWLICAATLGLAVGTLLYFVLPPRYEASTTILVEPQEIPRNIIQSTVTMTVDQRLRTLRERVTSYSNLNDLIDALGEERLDPTGLLTREEMMNQIRGGLGVAQGAQGRNAAVFNISYSSSDPELAAAVVRQIADLFVTENIKDRANQAAATADFLDRELARVRRDLAEKEEALRQFEQANMGSLPSQLESNLRELDRLNNALTANLEAQQATAERIASLREQLSQASGITTATPDRLTPGTPAHALATARAQLQVAERVYTDEHPNVQRLRVEVKELEEEVAEAQRRAAAGDQTALDPAVASLMRQIANQELAVASLAREETRVRGRLDLLQNRVEDTPALEAERQTLTRDYGNLQGTYQRLLKSKHEAALARNLESAQKGERFKVLRPARAPDTPAFPSLVLLLPGGLAVGMLIALGFILAAEIRNPSFRSVARLTRTLGLPVIASVPRIEDDRIFESQPTGDVDPRLVVHTAPDSAPAEQYRSFTPVFLEDEKRRVILVTSAQRGDGKSLTCMNLALTIARDLNRRVLLIDADLRRPTTHRLLRVRPSLGLADVLQREASLDEAVVHTRVPNLSLLPSGRTSANPLGLITDTSFLELLEHARTTYDAIFIDSPPLMPVVDTRLLRKLSDLVVFVVRADTTPRDAVVRALQDMREVAGVVFNQVSPGSFRRYYYYDAYSRYAYGDPAEHDAEHDDA